jgi:hypothetical protein
MTQTSWNTRIRDLMCPERHYQSLGALEPVEPESDTRRKIKDLYGHYIDDPQYVYKICQNSWIVIMKKLSDTKTNEGRKNIVNPMHVKYRANKLLVCVIFSVHDPAQTMKRIVNIYTNKSLIYMINKIVIPDHFDTDQEAVCSVGIHYFNSIYSALYYRAVPDQYTGHWINWYHNGQINEEGDYRNGKKIGLWTEWYENGQIGSICEYQNGNETGSWTLWYETGHMFEKGNLLKNVMTGSWTVWYENGQKKCEGDYLNGCRVGHWIEWYETGQKKFDGEYWLDVSS